LAAVRFVIREAEAWEQGGEHLAVAAPDFRESADDVVALEQADLHSGVT
jgi:hypothetical protein